MKKTFLLFLTAFFAVTFFFVGCKKSSTTEPPPTTTTPKTDQPIPTFSGTVDGVVAAIQFSYTVPNVPEPYNTVDMDMGFANFGSGTDAGTVTVNGKAIAKSTQGSSVYYNSFASTDPTNPPSSLNLNWNGSVHAWSVTGAGNTPAFTIDVTSPSAFSVTYPTASTVASKSSPLNITWTGANSGATDSMMVVLVAGSSTVTATTTNKTGGYSISASQLSAFSGDVVLEIVKYKFALKTVSSKNFVGVSEIVKMINFKVQ
ncbi:MAG: hypothetical protein M0P61_12645 [Ignavibacteriaceae bacterium]|nr:hypothetical protein [Ignavibacteriaceae bacterium]